MIYINKSTKGKVFEKNFQNSCKKQNIFCTRLRDNQVSFTTNEKTAQQPYDFEAFSSPHLLCVELKATNLNAVTFEREKNQSNKKMIHFHQIQGLDNASKYQGVFAGFLIDFLTSGQTYYLSIEKFMKFFHSTDKQSISEKDIIALSPIVVDKKLLRTNFEYDIKELFAELPLK